MLTMSFKEWKPLKGAFSTHKDDTRSQFVDRRADKTVHTDLVLLLRRLAVDQGEIWRHVHTPVRPVADQRAEQL